MVGRALGLGGRHAGNILVSKRSGACLHVDFSCLFDRAKGLGVPETVPFRLTRNVADGMGVLKTHGAFAVSARLISAGHTWDLLRNARGELLRHNHSG
jgi:serine/threonine-protein kinase ATR